MDLFYGLKEKGIVINPDFKDYKCLIASKLPNVEYLPVEMKLGDIINKELYLEVKEMKFTTRVIRNVSGNIVEVFTNELGKTLFATKKFVYYNNNVTFQLKRLNKDEVVIEQVV